MGSYFARFGDTLFIDCGFVLFCTIFSPWSTMFEPTEFLSVTQNEIEILQVLTIVMNGMFKILLLNW